MDLPERGGGSVEQTSLSALIGRGSHGSALSGRDFGHAGKTLPPLHACPYSSKRSYKVCGSREGIVRDSASDSESPFSDSPLPVSSRVCFVKYQDIISVGVAQHLTNTVFIDRALIVVPYSEGKIPDESKALSLLAPASAVAGLLPTPNPLASMGAVPLAALGALHGTGGCLDPTLAALGIPQPALLGGTVDSCKLDEIRRSVYVGNLTAHQSGGTDHLLNLFSQVGDLKMNSATATVIKPAVKNDSKEIEEAMKRVREAQSLISAAIDPDSAQKKDDKKKRSRSRSRSRRRRSRSRSRRRRSRSRSRRRSRDRRRSPRRRSRTPHRRTRSPRRRSRDRERDRDRERERDRVRRSPTPAKSRGPAFSVLLKSRDKRREERGEKKRRSKTPPRSYSSLRRSRSASRSPIPKSHSPRRRISRTPPAIKMRSPKRKASRSPSPKKHKKEKKRDKGRDRSRDRDLRSSGKKKKSKDKDRSRDRREKVDLEKSDVKGGQVIRNYDEEEMGYDSERGAGSTEGDGGVSPRDFASGPESRGVSPERSPGSSRNGDDVRYVDMDGSN